MFRSGDIVYFKEGKKGSSRKAHGARFKGHGIGVFLGHVGPFEKEPSADEAIKLIGACGYLSFDDVADFLGDEQAHICVKKYEERYYPVKESPSVKDTNGESVLVSANGQPLTRDESETPKLILSPKDMAALKEKIKPGETRPLLTVADLQKQIREITPEQVKAAIANAKSQFKVPLTPELEKEITTKVCGALGVDPETFQRSESGGQAAKASETAPAESVSKSTEKEVLPPIFPKRPPEGNA